MTNHRFELIILVENASPAEIRERKTTSFSDIDTPVVRFPSDKKAKIALVRVKTFPISNFSFLYAQVRRGDGFAGVQVSPAFRKPATKSVSGQHLNEIEIAIHTACGCPVQPQGACAGERITDVMITIDGSEKSGSGTIVRDLLPFSILTKSAVRLTNIRAKRSKPGLMPQHLKTIEAAAQISGGRLSGATRGAREISFSPADVISGGTFEWKIGTAGSTTMMALSLMPLGLFADRPSIYRISGGLFQDFAPSALHVRHVLLPLLGLMGVNIELEIVQPGYVPKGHGEIAIRVSPVQDTLKPLLLTDRGLIRRIRGTALSSHLQGREVSNRMAAPCHKILRYRGFDPDIEILYDTKTAPAYQRPAVQAGAALALWAETDSGYIIGADMAGARGRPAELIGKQTAEQLLQELESGSAVDRYTADQLIPFAALAEGTSRIRVPKITDHVEARLWLAEEILGAKTSIEGTTLNIEGIGYRSSP